VFENIDQAVRSSDKSASSQDLANKKFDHIITVLKQTDHKFIFFFDNLNCMLSNSASNREQFLVLINTLLLHHGFKILITAHDNLKSYGFYSPINELQIEVNCSNQKETYQIFMQHYRSNPLEEIRELADIKEPAPAVKRKGGKKPVEVTEDNIHEHKLFKLILRNPQAIIVCASLHNIDPEF